MVLSNKNYVLPRQGDCARGREPARQPGPAPALLSLGGGGREGVWAAAAEKAACALAWERVYGRLREGYKCPYGKYIE